MTPCSDQRPPARTTRRHTQHLRIAIGACVLGLLLLSTGCVSRVTRSVDARPIAAAPTAAPQELAQRLRVGVAVFDANVPGDYEEMLEEGVIPEVRKAEASYLPYALKTVLQQSGQWGEVRVLPRLSNAIDLTLLGRIEGSDGEHLALTIGATDATGRVWFNRKYEGYSSKYAYDPNLPPDIDPFRDVYRKVADDLASFYRQLTAEQVRTIKRVAELRFANEMAPEAFADYLRVATNGQVEARRLPADDDPMVGRIAHVREREFAFIDALDQHYENFNKAMHDPYQSYRRASYDEAVARRRLLEEARSRTIGGAAAVVGGLAAATQTDNGYAQSAGVVSIASGAALLKSGFSRRADAALRADALVELGTSLDAAVTPHVLSLESETLTLSGTVDEQYKALRVALARAWRRDLGLPVADLPAVGATADADAADADDADAGGAAEDSASAPTDAAPSAANAEGQPARGAAAATVAAPPTP